MPAAAQRSWGSSRVVNGFSEEARTRGLEAKAVNIVCLGRLIRRLRVHVPPSLTATCQLCQVSRRTGRNNYIGSSAANFHPIIRTATLRVRAVSQSQQPSCHQSLADARGTAYRAVCHACHASPGAHSGPVTPLHLRSCKSPDRASTAGKY